MPPSDLPSNQWSLVASCARGCERALKFELKDLGILRSRAAKGAVVFQAPPRALADVNVFSRIASRVLWVLAEFPADTSETLTGELAGIPFERFLDAETTFAIDAHLRGVAWSNSLYAAQRVKDVIVDRLRAKRIGRPNVDTRQPDVRFMLHWDSGSVTFAVDTTGTALHHRGYRPRSAGVAPMRENLAAALLAIGHADIRRPFWDPVCGTGTLGIEQGLRALRRFPGAKRRFAFERWRFTPRELHQSLAEAKERARDEEKRVPEAPIRISDHDEAQLERARYGLERMGLGQHVEVRHIDATTLRMADERPVVVGNLPFGERMGRDDERALRALYQGIGGALERVPDLRALFLSSHPQTDSWIGLGPHKSWSLYSGALPSVLYRWDR